MFLRSTGTKLFIIISGFCSFGIPALMRNFSYVSDVAEGDFATFSCTIEKYSGNILWRVGAHTVQCCGGDTVALPGSGTNINCTVSEGEADVVEVMGIEATPGLDGAPVECVLESFEGRSHNEFSQFVIIHVISLPPSPLAHLETTMDREGSGLR